MYSWITWLIVLVKSSSSDTTRLPHDYECRCLLRCDTRLWMHMYSQMWHTTMNTHVTSRNTSKNTMHNFLNVFTCDTTWLSHDYGCTCILRCDTRLWMQMSHPRIHRRIQYIFLNVFTCDTTCVTWLIQESCDTYEYMYEYRTYS
jgi:hypothetical protein